MSTAVVITADLIQSKKHFSQPGGYHDIVQRCSTMRAFIEGMLKQQTDGQGITISRFEPQGDDIAFQLAGATLRELADISVATAIHALRTPRFGRHFRYVLYTLELDGDYFPRIKQFAAISKTEAGSAHHLAVERRMISYVHQTISRWLEAAPHNELHVPLHGESYTGALFDLYCVIGDRRPSKAFRWRYSRVTHTVLSGASQLPAPLENDTKRAIVADSEQNTHHDRLSVANYSQLLSWQWDHRRVGDEVINLIYATMEGLTESDAGSSLQWGPVFSDHPDSWRLLVTDRRAVVGYWHFVALCPDEFQEALRGHLLDAMITAERIQSFELPGDYNIYIAGLCVRSEYRGASAFRLLLSSLLDVISDLAHKDIFIGEICTNAITSFGVSLCETLGMQQCAQHAAHGSIYHARFADLLNKPVFHLKPEIRSAYRASRS